MLMLERLWTEVKCFIGLHDWKTRSVDMPITSRPCALRREVEWSECLACGRVGEVWE